MSSNASALDRGQWLMAPGPYLLLWELPFWIAILYISLVPGSVAPWWSWGELPIRSAEGAVGLAALWFGIASVVRASFWPTHGERSSGVRVFLAICGWALLTTSWNGTDEESRASMQFSIALAASAAVAAWGLVAAYSREEIRDFLWRLTGFLALLSVLYAAESILSLGLRSEMGQNTLNNFGIERVKGPLFGSSTGYLVLLPALAFAVHEAIARQRRVLAIWTALALLTALLGLGSRAALLMLAVYMTMLTLLIKNARKRFVAIVLTASLSAAAAAMVFSQASTERLQNLEDDTRRATYQTALRTVVESDWPSVLRGSGYGGVWSWYLRDARHGARLAVGDNVILTPMGLSLYHSHSTFLTSVVELGLPGFAGFAALVLLLIGVTRRSWSQGEWQPLACGVCASALGFFFDLFLFKNTTVNLIWWLYAICAMRLTARREA